MKNVNKPFPAGALPYRQFLKMALTLASPIMLQNLISALVGSADTLMLGYVSQTAMSASSLANQLQNILSMSFYGLTAGASVLASQYWGKHDTRTIERVLGLAAKFALAISFVFFAVGFFFPQMVMHCFTEDEEIIVQGISYLRIVAVSYLLQGLSQIFVSVMRSTEKVVMPTLVYVVSLTTNVLLNAAFIFGWLGLPKLGLIGVALGTLIARTVELLICLVYSRTRSAIRLRVRWIIKRGGVLTHDLMSVALPSMINDLAWSLASTMYSVIIGHLGTDVVAANAVAIMAVNLGAVVCRGFANATTIIVSKPLGAGETETAKLYGSRMLKLTAVMGILAAGVIIALKPLVMTLYADKLTERALQLLGFMLYCRGVQIIGEGINTCMICGCFRGGGDARYGMIADTGLMWCVAVPLALLAAFVFHLSEEGVYVVICLDEFEKMLPFYLHYRKFGWLKNLTRDA